MEAVTPQPYPLALVSPSLSSLCLYFHRRYDAFLKSSSSSSSDTLFFCLFTPSSRRFSCRPSPPFFVFLLFLLAYVAPHHGARVSTPSVLGVDGMRIAQERSEEGVRLLPHATEGEWRGGRRKNSDDHHRSHTLEEGDSLNGESEGMRHAEERWLHDDVSEYKTTLQRKGIDENEVDKSPSFVAVHGKSGNGEGGEGGNGTPNEARIWVISILTVLSAIAVILICIAVYYCFQIE
ncbi:hypothetical protein CSUI_001218 [Cystoisospora suis]|uniref:Transmembrane protein n=1 Tax=Cystoisospora suis TaxID=483139 RepID=A0A2C6LB88_9APIC|nr:hypothetical protein CSUI_001218 [Cystoisospora suis]